MSAAVDRAVAIVGLGAVLPDAPDVPSFWKNLRDGRYSITETPVERWDPRLYYDPDRAAPDKTYSKIGGWVKEYEWNPMKWRMPIPPKVAEVMDPAQKWAVVAARQALNDFGYPDRPLDRERTAVIVGNALGGDFHLRSAARILFPEIGEELVHAPSFQALPDDVRAAVFEELTAGVRRRIPDITEDTMPGELGNIVAGRVAALFDFHGPNYITDAACASTLAALTASVEGLAHRDFDAVLTGGIDANMSASTFVKFAKIGALSGTGSRPYAEGADGFVMGEGAAVFLLKRLADAERDGDRIYAVIRGFGGSSDGKGKGITAPNPTGPRLAIQRGWQQSGLVPSPGDMVEGHGTSTRVGDVVEVESMTEVFKDFDLPVGSIALGSVKSNIGHLKGAAGAAGLLKATLAIHEKTLPPSVNFHAPNPGIDFSVLPFRVNTELRSWDKPGAHGDAVRRAGVSAFGFGGTNFHIVLEEYVPGRITPSRVQVPGAEMATPDAAGAGGVPMSVRAPVRGALVIGGNSRGEIANKLRNVEMDAKAGSAPAPAPPLEVDLRAPVRLAIDYGDADELAASAGKALTALQDGQDGRWRALRNRGIFVGEGAPGKVAFLLTGQGSQYVNMLRELRDREPVVARTFAEADRTMEPLLGRPLTDHVFVDASDEDALARAAEGLKQTAVTQPAVLTVDTAMCRLFERFGIVPDMVMGHSLGEYGALVAAGGLPFGDALEAVAARGEAMTRLALDDNGIMAAVFGPADRVAGILEGADGYVVVANFNSNKECVIGGATEAMGRAMEALRGEGFRVTRLPVSHAFHTRIVEPAAEPLMEVLRGLDVHAPRIPLVANVDGSFYPTGPDAPERIVEILGRQIGSPVQFVKGLNALYDAGARVFVEMGPKRVLYGFAGDVLGARDGVRTLFTNHPRTSDLVGVNRALCGMYAEGLGVGVREVVQATSSTPSTASEKPPLSPPVVPGAPPAPTQGLTRPPVLRAAAADGEDRYVALGRMFADFLDRSFELYAGERRAPAPVRVGITGASLGLPGGQRVFNEDNVARALRGEQFISSVSPELRDRMLDLRITRLVKGAGGEARFETLQNPEDVLKIAGRGGSLDLVEDFGFPEDRLQALDRVTRLAIAAGIEALRDAGIPLVLRYKSTTTGSKLPVGWALPEEMRDDTGVVFASAFPGYNQFAHGIESYHRDRALRERLAELEAARASLEGHVGGGALEGLDARIDALRAEVEASSYSFDRRFLFQILSMGHSQFAEFIGARGPNTALNAACASGTQAIAVARDWIETGRCRHVIVITADDVTTDALFPWVGSGLLATGAAATDARVEDAALPFDRRRHGLIIGMGGAALVLEDLSAAAERGIRPICEILGTQVANSAFHGSRLDVDHISDVMERLVSDVEARWGLHRASIAPETVFVSHETYTPARGGSASAEVKALRDVFGASANQIVVANTKGYTGHPMGVAIEDTLAVKMLETGIVPPVANFREVDPDLGMLNLSRGGSYPVQYALRLAAGFGSQISMNLLRWTPPPDGARRNPQDLGFRYRVADPAVWSAWLARVTGYPEPELEVVQHTLRVRDEGPPAVEPARAARVAPSRARAVTAGVAPPEPVTPPSEVPPSAPVVPRPVSAPAPVASVREAKAASDVPAPVAFTAPSSGGAPATPSVDPVAVKVLEIVSEQTGYPVDMLELDLDLEADLGIDTVKQAEMFAAIREAWGIERDGDLALRDYPTLKHAIEFVYEKRPDLAPATAAAAPVAAEAATAPSTVPVPAEAGGISAAAGEPGVTDPVAVKVLEIVSEQTGYPVDMLELDLDLEADLGIDTVKQAEMFAAIREAWGIERDGDLALRDYPTLKHAIEFVYEKRPDLAPAAAAAAPTPTRAPTDASPAEPAAPEGAPAGASVAGGAPRGSEEAAQAVPRRVPVALLRPPLDRFPTTGVTLDGTARVLVVPDEAGVGRSLADRLEKRGVGVWLVDPSLSTEDLVDGASAWAAQGPVTGAYWLPAMDPVLDAELTDAEDRREAIRRRVKSLHAVMRVLFDLLGNPGSFLISGTRMGGMHGYDEAGATDAVGGAVSGFTKAFGRERPECVVKVVDFEPSNKTAALADLLIKETLRDPGAVEVGYAGGRRWTVGLEEQPTAFGDALPDNPTFLVTGAAGSIVSAIITDLAEAKGGTYWLLDLVAEPDMANPDFPRLDSDRDDLKRDIFRRLQEGGERGTPVQVERVLARLERERSAVRAIRAIEQAGGTAHYRSLDLRDPDAVRSVVEEIVEAHGGVDVLIHAAGLEISRGLPEKSADEFALVFDVKVEGWYNLVAALGEAPLGAAVVFSSIAGRFGNAGQTDYSAANDLLCKAVSQLRRTRPDTCGVSIDWTAWRDIGMASRGSIPTVMRQAGIDMLAPEAGIPVVRRELAAGSRGEVVVARSLGVMLAEDAEAIALDERFLKKAAEATGPMVGTVEALSLYDGLVVETLLDPGKQPFLTDHRIDGIAVLPGVMGVEAMAEAARVPFPERYVGCVEGVEFHAPFKFYRDEPRTVTVQVRYGIDGEDIVAHCRLLGSRTLVGRTEPEITTHFTARVRLVGSRPSEGEERAIPAAESDVVDASAIYRTYFHGPAYQVLRDAWKAGTVVVGRFSEGVPPNHDPSDRPTLTTPRMVELAFQTAGLAEIAESSRMGLPHHVDRLDLFGVTDGREGGVALVEPAGEGAFNVDVTDEAGRLLLSVRGYRTSRLPRTVGAEAFASLKA